MAVEQSKAVARELFARFSASGGRICAVREYLDTQHAHDVWLAP
jgi:ketosteroid isomerase-like protein